jgi:hypothetical protein
MLRGKPRYERFSSQQRTLANFDLSNLHANKETAENKRFNTIFLVLAALFDIIRGFITLCSRRPGRRKVRP